MLNDLFSKAGFRISMKLRRPTRDPPVKVRRGEATMASGGPTQLDQNDQVADEPGARTVGLGPRRILK